MKKIITTILLLMLSVTLVSCTNKNKNENENETNKVFGLTMNVESITEKELTCTITNDGSMKDEELFTGCAYDIEEYNNENNTWTSAKNCELSWNDIAILLNGKSHIEYPYTFYIPLEFFNMINGHYRVVKKITHTKSNNTYEDKNIYAEFDYILEK